MNWRLSHFISSSKYANIWSYCIRPINSPWWQLGYDYFIFISSLKNPVGITLPSTTAATNSRHSAAAWEALSDLRKFSETFAWAVNYLCVFFSPPPYTQVVMLLQFTSAKAFCKLNMLFKYIFYNVANIRSKMKVFKANGSISWVRKLKEGKTLFHKVSN